MSKLLDHFYSMDHLFSHLFDAFKCEKNGKSWTELVYFIWDFISSFSLLVNFANILRAAFHSIDKKYKAKL